MHGSGFVHAAVKAVLFCTCTGCAQVVLELFPKARCKANSPSPALPRRLVLPLVAQLMPEPLRLSMAGRHPGTRSPGLVSLSSDGDCFP